MASKLSTISALDAKNRLGNLLDRVERGEELTITRRGRAVARLVPVDGCPKDSWETTLAKITKIREQMIKRGKFVTAAEIKAWKAEGRR